MSAALVATSLWLSATSVGYLVATAIATVAAAGLAVRLPRRIRRWSLTSALVVGVGIWFGVGTQVRLDAIQRDWPAESARLRRESIQRLRDAVVLSANALERDARQASVAPADRAAAFTQLRDFVRGSSREITLYRGDSAFAWSGRPRISTDGLAEELGVTSAPFYLSLYATRRSAEGRAVASELLFAAPPADRLAGTIAGRVARATGVASFRFAPLSASATDPDMEPVRVRTNALFLVDAVLPSIGEMRLRELERARTRVGAALLLALVGYLVAAWRLRRSAWWRAAVVGVGVACTAVAPLSAYSNLTLLFDPAIYYTPLGGPLTANAAALGLTGALVLLLLLSIVRRQARVVDRRLAVAIVIVVAGSGPFLLRDLARGIQIPAYGVSAPLWLTWQVPLFLAGVAVMLAGAAAGSAMLGGKRGLPPFVAPALAAMAALLAPIVWDAPGQWPWWYTALWILTVGSLALSRRTAVVVSAATVAAFGAMTLVWGGTTRARVRLAEQDIAMLGTGDAYARALADRLGDRLTGASAPDRRALLAQYATSELAAAGYPVWLAAWRTPTTPVATLSTAPIPVPAESLRATVARARALRAPVRGDWRTGATLAHTVAVPSDSGVVTIAVAPRTRLIASDPFARLLGLDAPAELEPAYLATVSRAGRLAVAAPPTRTSWRREGDELHGDWTAASGGGAVRAHVEVALRPLEALIQRGALIALLDLAIVGLLWLTSVVADGVAARWLQQQGRLWARSYRIRLTLALFAFFMVPAIAFAVWSYRQLSTDATRSRELLVRETLRSVTPGASADWMARESNRVGSPLLLFDGGALVAASDSLLLDVAPVGQRLDPTVAQAMLVHGEAGAFRNERFSGATMQFGYRALETAAGRGLVLAAPARVDDVALAQRGRDLGILVLFATAVGALAALWLSGIAARELARPIGSLRRAALALAGGQREPQIEGQPTTEFSPVFAAFRRMVSDLESSRSKEAQAERVLAWGEMARQVAHEIKNPLTPIRLGVQHLKRARSDARVDFDRVLDQNVERILSEIDRLDEIARAFSRYGQPPEQRAGAEPTDVAAVLRDLVELETMGADGVRWTLHGADGEVNAMARREELREVMLNVLENARLAKAADVKCSLVTSKGTVAILVRDTGQGIAPDVLPRIFEPHFSTRTSGSGLGLAVSRRLIESWGGSIEITSVVGTGTDVLITLRSS